MDSDVSPRHFPTTVLSEKHFNNFSVKRSSNFHSHGMFNSPQTQCLYELKAHLN